MFAGVQHTTCCVELWHTEQYAILHSAAVKRNLTMFFQVYDDVISSVPKLNRFRVSHRDWTFLEQLEEFLRPFAEVTTSISGEKYSSAGLAFAYYESLMQVLEGNHQLITPLLSLRYC